MDFRTAALAAALWCAAGGALAQQAPLQDAADIAAQIDDLQHRVDALQARLAELRRQAPAAAPTQTAAAPPAQPVAAPPPVTVAATLRDGRPTLTSSDGQFKASLRTVLQFDAAHYDQDAPLTPDNRRSDSANPSDLNSGTNFRRARLGVEGTFSRLWNYNFTAEFGGSGTEAPILNAAYLEYAGWKPWTNADALRIRIGAWATPTGLEDATPNTDTLFLERPAAAELVRNRAGGDGRSGVGVLANGATWYASGVLTGSVIGNSGDFDEQTAFLTRAAFLPVHGDDYAVHVGASIQGILDPADTNAGAGDTKVIRLRERPELRVDAQRFADTGAIPSDSATAYGLELAGVWRNFYLAGEAFRIDVSRNDAIADPNFSGWYVQGAWTITREHRAWSGPSGGFLGVRPASPFDPSASHWGAWEIGARYSVLDLDYRQGALGTAPGADSVRGGEQTISALGLNWYPNNSIRFLLDYQWVDIDRLDPEVTSTIVTPVPGFGAQIGQNYRVISLRSQFAF